MSPPLGRRVVRSDIGPIDEGERLRQRLAGVGTGVGKSYVA